MPKRTPKRRDAVARSLEQGQYRHRVIPDKREAAERDRLLDEMQRMGDEPLPPGTVVVTPHGSFTTGDDDDQDDD